MSSKPVGSNILFLIDGAFVKKIIKLLGFEWCDDVMTLLLVPATLSRLGSSGNVNLERYEPAEMRWQEKSNSHMHFQHLMISGRLFIGGAR